MAFLMTGWSQAQQREAMEYRDQHDRVWFAWGAVKAHLHPASPLSPQFQAPWYPDPGFFEFIPKKPGQFRINYDAMVSAGRAANRAYRDLKMKAAAHFNVPNYDPDTDQPTAQMVHDIGPEPLPLDPILAARAGNGYVLGLRDFDPKKPGDVKIREALKRWYPAQPEDREGAEFADAEFSEAESEAILATRGRKRQEAARVAG